MSEELLTVDEVAARLRVHPESVRRWIREGELRASLLSKRAGYRIRVSAIDAFLRSRERDFGGEASKDAA